MTKHNKKMAQNNSRRPKMTKNDAKKLSVTDGRTDGPTDRVGYRVACTRLKTQANMITWMHMNVSICHSFSIKFIYGWTECMD